MHTDYQFVNEPKPALSQLAQNQVVLATLAKLVEGMHDIKVTMAELVEALRKKEEPPAT